MTVQAAPFLPELLAYLRQINTPHHSLLTQIRAETANHRLGKMSIATEQADLLAWLARLMGVKHYLEIGTFTGYSSTVMALALPDEARLTCCDVNVTFTDWARKYWQQAGVAHKIMLHLQPALITLDELLDAGQAEQFDLALIDADKPSTPHYFERCLKLIRPGGVIAIDNVLLSGRVLHVPDERSSESLLILQQFNASLPLDERIVALTLPLGDGLTLVLKK